MKELTIVLVDKGDDLINEGFGDVVVSSNTVVTGFKSVCP